VIDANYLLRGFGANWLFMLKAFMDESGHSDDPFASFVGMGGIVAENDSWISFDIAWKASPRCVSGIDL
jgi:hypothetical protein